MFDKIKIDINLKAEANFWGVVALIGTTAIVCYTYTSTRTA